MENKKISVTPEKQERIIANTIGAELDLAQIEAVSGGRWVPSGFGTGCGRLCFRETDQEMIWVY